MTMMPARGLLAASASLAWQQTTHPLEDISDTPGPKTNERLNEAKWLLCVALE